jgi:UDP-N-acetyl-D-glucosamine dehydrogenase
MKRVGVIGQGYVGLALATAAANAGHTVLGYDTNTELVNALKQGKSHIEDVASETLGKLISSGKYTPTNDSSKLNGCEIIIIAVPTPLNKERQPDLNFLEAAVETIASVITNEILIINESTSYPGTLRKLIKPIFDKQSKNTFLFLIRALIPKMVSGVVENRSAISSIDSLSTRKRNREGEVVSVERR